MATVITSLASALPIIGQPIVNWLWGGFSVDNPTLNRFYSFHYLLPFILAALSLVHLAALHQYGSTNPIGVNSSTDQIDFYPYYYAKDFVGLCAVGFFAALIVFFYPDILSHPDNNIPANPYSTPAHIVPEYNTCSPTDHNVLWIYSTRCGKIHMTKKITCFQIQKNSRIMIQQVKRFFSNEPSAGEDISFIQKIQTYNLQCISSLQRLNVEHPYDWIDWFSGFIDGNGCFYFTQTSKDTWVFSFKITQSIII